MIIKAYIYENEAINTERGYFVGECEDIPIKTNIPYLKGQLVEFYGATKDEVAEQIISVLKKRGITGKLRIM
jgi:hypothetical protein